MTQKKGMEAEQKALDFLIDQGLRLVNRNYSCYFGEVDLIMRDKNHLVFIEVRARTSQRFGGAVASITPMKIKKIIKTTSHYLVCHKIKDNYPIRFDVVSFDGIAGHVNWIKNAFSAD